MSPYAGTRPLLALALRRDRLVVPLSVVGLVVLAGGSAKSTVDLYQGQDAVDAARAGVSGVVGQDEERDDELRTIEFDRIAGGKAFDTGAPWFQSVLRRTGQA